MFRETLLVSFNPCFSGTAFATKEEKRRKKEIKQGFNPCFSGTAFATRQTTVLIHQINPSFNPCFSGTAFATLSILLAFCIEIGDQVFTISDASCLIIFTTLNGN